MNNTLNYNENNYDNSSTATCHVDDLYLEVSSSTNTWSVVFWTTKIQSFGEQDSSPVTFDEIRMQLIATKIFSQSPSISNTLLLVNLPSEHNLQTASEVADFIIRSLGKNKDFNRFE